MGKLQNEDVKSLAELTGAGGTIDQLINDTKIYVSVLGLNKQLSDAIVDGDLSGGSAIVSSFASPTSVTAGGGIPFSSTSGTTVLYAKSNSGAVDISANPQIAAGTVDGQILEIVFTSDTDTLLIEDGTGVDAPGDFLSEAKRKVQYRWDAGRSVWSENWRR